MNHPTLANLLLQNQRALMDFVKHADLLHEQWIPSDKVKQDKMSMEVNGAPGFSISLVEYITKYHTTVALGLNVFLSMHVDSRDMLILSTCIILDGEWMGRIIDYFCFPEQGLAIPMHSGKFIFFNPYVPHMVRSCCSNHDRLFCISLYVLGGEQQRHPTDGAAG